MASMSHPTTNQNEIRCWASSQKAIPAEILPGLVDAVHTELAFFIPGQTGAQPKLRIIPWEHFFASFEAHGLAFTHELLPTGGPGPRFELLQIDAKAPDRGRPHPEHDSDTAPFLVP
jgi:hypothetical protein